ncbi:MAG: FAD-binding oxidoreductase [Alphaproteobacteria bacterium]|nr:FAD-binding oxidoreductase [Alphaproteobacteria bacterium]
MIPTPLEGSLWQALAPPPEDNPPLDGEATTDVVVVGAGFCGLSCALHLAEKGIAVTVLEAEEPGFGASGRNNGQCTPDWTYRLPDELERWFGPEHAERVNALQGKAADLVFSLIRAHQISCDAVQCGTLNVVRRPESARMLAAKHAQWTRRGFKVAWLEGADLRDHVASDRYRAGVVYPDGGHLNPLGYARGLARAARNAGARIHGRSRVTSLAREADGWRVSTARGGLRARAVVLATNAHRGGLWPGRDEAFYLVRAFGLTSQPVPADVRRQALPIDHAFAETIEGELFFFFDPSGHLVTGGGVGLLTNDTLERAAARFRRVVGRVFPALADLTFDRYWQGWLDMVPRKVVGVFEPAPDLYAALGFSGRGVPTATAVGRDIALTIASGDKRTSSFPLGPLPRVRTPRLGEFLIESMVMPYHDLMSRVR